ncbi:MAG TPA: diguanylate cyclase [Nitrospirota bacterium]|nr:diguanylate cyclase [Nitrospirota bacterium]
MKFPLPQAILDALTPNRIFAKLSIASKMLLGYTMLVALTVVVVVYVLINLQRLNSMNKDVIKIDIRVQESADKMLDALLAQDTYEKRYLILRREDIRNLFWKRGEELDAWIAGLKTLPEQEDLPLKKLEALHKQYSDLFMNEMKLIDRGNIAEATVISNGELKDRFETLLDVLRSMSAGAKQSQDRQMKSMSHLSSSAFAATALLCVLSIILGVLAGMVVTHHISSSINKLREATNHFAEGNFKYDPRISTEDEIGNLSSAFLAMGKRLVKLEEMYLDASPLTRLPGGIAIENALKLRLESRQPIAFCVIDLDNFKSFNDHYGYAYGNEVIKETARIIEVAAKAKGTPEDFVGHVGGDDFVVITIPEHMREISSEIIRQFDERVPHFYDEEDRKNGFILGKNRQGEEVAFPLMTISIAIVTNEQRTLTNPLEASEIAAELKDYAKTIAQSVFVVDKRRTA